MSRKFLKHKNLNQFGHSTLSENVNSRKVIPVAGTDVSEAHNSPCELIAQHSLRHEHSVDLPPDRARPSVQRGSLTAAVTSLHFRMRNLMAPLLQEHLFLKKFKENWLTITSGLGGRLIPAGSRYLPSQRWMELAVCMIWRLKIAGAMEHF